MGSYKFDKRTVKVKDCDTDIEVLLPDGKRLVLQYRIESPSLDVCFDQNYPVICWEGTDMKPAPPFKKRSEIRVAGQLVVELDSPIGEKFQ